MSYIPDILGEEETAALLRCAPSTVREKARTGYLPGLQFGDGGWIFPRSALLEHLHTEALAKAKCRAIQNQPNAISVPVSSSKKRVPAYLPDIGRLDFRDPRPASSRT